MKDGDGLNDVLGYSRLVEGNQHSEHLSKMYLETVKPAAKTVEAVDKKIQIPVKREERLL